MNLTQEQLAYTAGFLEGDGSFQIMRYRSKKSGYVYEYRISGYNTKEEVIKWLHEKIGGYYASVTASGRNKKPYHWNIKNKEAIELAELIYPYLIAKKNEVGVWLEYAYTIVPNRTNKMSQESINHRIDLINRIRDIRNNQNLVTKQSCYQNSLLKPIHYPTQTEIAYLAGLSDAEGCFRLHRINKKNRPNPIYATVFEIGNTNDLFFPWLMAKFGGNITFRPSTKEKFKDLGLWYVMASQLRLFIHDLNKYLIIKKPVCEKIIEFDQTNISNGGDRHSEKFKSAYKQVLIKRDIIFDQIQSLNAKGHH